MVVADNTSLFDAHAGIAVHDFSMAINQYFTLPHGFRRIPVDSHGMLEFHPESAGMVGISYSDGFRWILNGIPMDSAGF